ncbi:hypothetical protein [Acidithiobacillus sp.]
MKDTMIYHHFQTRAQAKSVIRKSIEFFYNDQP